MRYIPSNHLLVNNIVNTLGIPHKSFKMSGDTGQNIARKAYLRNNYYRMDEWETSQSCKKNLLTAYNIDGPIVGM